MKNTEVLMLFKKRFGFLFLLFTADSNFFVVSNICIKKNIWSLLTLFCGLELNYYQLSTGSSRQILKSDLDWHSCTFGVINAQNPYRKKGLGKEPELLMCFLV